MRLFFSLFTFSLFCAVSADKHSLKLLLTGSSGLPDIPEFTAVALVDDVIAAHCNSINKTIQPRQEWVKKLMDNEPARFHWYNGRCGAYYEHFRTFRKELQMPLNDTEGVHVLQQVFASEWDDETGQVNAVSQFAFDGEDFIALDLQKEMWNALKPQAIIVKQIWDRDRKGIKSTKRYLLQDIPEWVKFYLFHGNSFLQRRELPSVSLLHKTPSSPVSCHATGFYPDKAMIFWRKDEEEIHEDVAHGEILPNHDGTFQMSVDLNLSSVRPEDWRRYDCVFNLSGVKDDIITILDKDKIRTNWVPPSVFPAAAVGGVIVLLLLLLTLGLIELYMWRKKKNGFRRTQTSEDVPPSDKGTQKI